MTTVRSVTLTETVDLVTEQCCACGVLFAMTSNFNQQCRDNPDKWFYCPVGHRQHYTGQSLAEKLRLAHERNELLSQMVANRDEDLRAERAGHAVTKGKLTKTRNRLCSTQRRVAAGVCPCCHRTFQQLARHMAGQHPEYSPERPA